MSTILIVEDDTNVRKLVAVNLSRRGYHILEAGDVQQALAYLRVAPPDLMVLDIKLPDKTGWELLAEMAQDPGLGLNFPVLVMTASLVETHVDRDRYPNVVDVLIKPFSAMKLVAAVHQVLP